MRANAIITKLNHETQEAMQTRAHDVDVIGNIVNYERSSSQVEFLQLAQLVPWHGTILKRGPGWLAVQWTLLQVNGEGKRRRVISRK